VTRRVAVLLLAGPVVSAAAPPGVGGAAFAAAMAEDVFTVFGDLDGVDEAIAHTPAWTGLAQRIRWPQTRLFAVPEADAAAGALAAAAAAGYTEAVLVAADAPDLPALHLAKVFSALGTAAIAVAVSVTGGLVLLATRLPAPTLTRTRSGADLDGGPPAGARETLPWRRLRQPADLARLDPGLEGWEATRALLSGLRL